MDTKKIKNGLVTIVATAVFGGLAGGFCAGVVKDGIHDRAWRNAIYLADKKNDNNKFYSPEEYTSIYTSLGLKDTDGNALDLTTEQLKKYVAENEK